MNREEMEEIKRYFGVVAEGLERKVQQVAEGVTNLDEKLERFRQEVAHEFKEVKSMIKLSYAEMDRRMAAVESRRGGLESPAGPLGGARVTSLRLKWDLV